MTTETFTKLITQNFNSVSGDSTNAKATKLCSTLFDNFSFTVNARTLTRYYNQYVLNTEEKRTPEKDIVEMLCKNVGYTNFEMYKKQFARTEDFQKRNYARLVFSIFIVSAVIAIGIVLVSNLTSDNCITWNGESYVDYDCAFNKHPQTNNDVLRVTASTKSYRNLKKIVVYDTTTIKKAEKPIVWYGKSEKGEVQFFNTYGIHPVTGKTLKECSYLIRNNYGISTDD